MDRAYSSSSESGYIKPRSVSSKNPAVSALQDLLFYQLTGIGYLAEKIMHFNKQDKNLNNRISRLLYLTNKGINFRITTMINAIKEAFNFKEHLEKTYKLLIAEKKETVMPLPASATFKPEETLSQMVSQANIINAQKNIQISNINIFSMQEIIRQSLTSSANYFEYIKTDNNLPKNIYNLFYEILSFLSQNNATLNECQKYALNAGELHTQVLELLMNYYEKNYGFAVRKKVSTSQKKGAAILVVGEDFDFLKKLLEETSDSEINIYTYGVMSYANVFPELYKYKNLIGIYLGKHDDIAADIEEFPGVVVLTGGTFEDLTDIYRGRVFSTEEISMLGITRISKDNLQPLINTAFDAPGFENNAKNQTEEIGINLSELEKYTDKIFKLITKEKIKNLEVFLGCNYYINDKNYLKNFTKALPNNIIFITIGCLCGEAVKNKHSHIFNLGQYINLFSFIRFIFALSGKLQKDINSMPVLITINLKNSDSIAALLMLLSLGIKNIKVNSDLPNYLTEGIISTFGTKYNVSRLSELSQNPNDILSEGA